MLVSGVFVTLMAIRTRPLTPVIILRGVRSVSLGLGALWLVALEIGFSRILHRVRFDADSRRVPNTTQGHMCAHQQQPQRGRTLPGVPAARANAHGR